MRVFCGLALTAVLIGCGVTPSRTTYDASLPFWNLDPAVQYVGPDACRSCHTDNHETFRHSEMGRSFKKATLSMSAADFTVTTPVYDPHRDFYYLPFHRGEDLFIMEYRLSGRDTVYKRVEKIDYIVGSGQHTNSHIMDVNGYLFQMPLTWYVQEGRWDLPPGFADGVNKRFDRPIEVECMSCHNARPDFVEGSGNRYRSVPEGIDCEQCHGPGEIHVDAMRSGRVVDVKTEIDRTIVNPAKLDADLQFDVCQRCHLQGTVVPVEGKSFLDFRPGLELGDVLKVFQPRYADSLSQFIMASHPDRLRMSRCYIRSRGTIDNVDQMTCITCHDPHVSIESMGPIVYRDACQSCHESEALPQCTESLEDRAAAGDNCATCHMPVSGSKDIPHVRITDHFIRVPPKLSAREFDAQKEFFQLASLSDPRPSARTMAEGYLAHYEQFEHHPAFLDSAAAHMGRALQTVAEDSLMRPLIRLRFLEGDYGQVAALAERVQADTMPDAWTLYRIGESYAKEGNVRNSIRYYEMAVQAAPEHLQFRTKLATAYTADRQLDRALQIFNAVVNDHPFHADALNNRGFAYAMKGDFEQAEKDFQRALAMNPDLEQALANLASLYINTERNDDARLYLERLIEMDPDNRNYQRLMEIL